MSGYTTADTPCRNKTLNTRYLDYSAGFFL